MHEIDVMRLFNDLNNAKEGDEFRLRDYEVDENKNEDEQKTN